MSQCFHLKLFVIFNCLSFYCCDGFRYYNGFGFSNEKLGVKRPTHSQFSLSSSISSASAQMKDIRQLMEKDEKTSLMMDALRGKNINDDDRQGDGIDMKVVEMRAGIDIDDVLPTTYDSVKLEAYFKKSENNTLNKQPIFAENI